MADKLNSDCILMIWEAEAGGSGNLKPVRATQQVQGQPGLYEILTKNKQTKKQRHWLINHLFLDLKNPECLIIFM